MLEGWVDGGREGWRVEDGRWVMRRTSGCRVILGVWGALSLSVEGCYSREVISCYQSREVVSCNHSREVIRCYHSRVVIRCY